MSSLIVFTISLGWAYARTRGSQAVAGVSGKEMAVEEGYVRQEATKPDRSAVVRGPSREYTVQHRDTLWRIGVRYGVSLHELLAVNPNLDPGKLQVGQRLMLPSHAREQPLAEVDEQLSLGGAFIWPVDAPVSSYFGPRWGRFHAGIDLAADSGDPIKAARDGHVLLSGAVQGYGNTVVLEHSDGSRTLYGHASKLLVKAGQQVKQGETIALVGTTGNSTGPHLHFEVIVEGKPRDPLSLLPKR